MDEADRLLDLGFSSARWATSSKESATRSRRGAAAARRQNVLVSATLDARIQRLADLALHEPALVGFDEKAETEHVGLDSSDAAPSTSVPDSISHHALLAESRHRLVALAAFLRRETLHAEKRGGQCKAIVFFSTCNRCGIPPRTLHAAVLATAAAPPQSRRRSRAPPPPWRRRC